MKNIFEVLRQKEAEISRLQKELQALHIAAPLLQDDPFLGDRPEEEASVTALAVIPETSEAPNALMLGKRLFSV